MELVTFARQPRWNAACVPHGVRISLGIAMLLTACAGNVAAAPPSPAVEITYAFLVDDGEAIRGAVEGWVTASTEGGPVRLWAGARPLRRSQLCAAIPADQPSSAPAVPCQPPPGWFLDVSEYSRVVFLAPGERRAIRVPVRSGNRRATDPLEYLAECGESVTVFLVPEGDGAQGGAFETTYQCGIDAFRRP